MSAFRILVAEYAPLPGWLALEPDIEVIYAPELWRDPVQLIAAARLADALVVRNAARVDEMLIAQAPGLRVVGRVGSGLDNIDLSAAGRAGLPVVYAPGANANAVAEYCIAQAIWATRRLLSAHETTRAGGWERTAHVGREMRELVFGVVGFGHIGRRVRDLAQCFGARTLVSSRHAGIDAAQGFVSREELFENADVVSLHLDACAETHRAIGAHLLLRLRPNAVFINTARGEIVDETALARTARMRPDCTFVLDVREAEPPREPALGALPNVIHSPHIAAFSAHAQHAIADTVFHDVLTVLRGGAPAFPFAAPQVEPDPRLAPV